MERYVMFERRFERLVDIPAVLRSAQGCPRVRVRLGNL